MNRLIPSARFILPLMLLSSALLTGCGASIDSSLPNQQTTLYLSQDTTVDFSVTGDTGNDLSYSWQIIQYDSNNQPVSSNYLQASGSELKRSYTFTANDFSHFRTEVKVSLYQLISTGTWPLNVLMDSVTWEISKPVEKLGTQIPDSVFVRNSNDLPNLSGISDVTGHVFLDNTTFRDAAALGSLTHIGGDLVINRSKIRTAKDLHLNPALVLEGGLQLRNNSSLTSLTGLENIPRLDELVIEKNRLLKNLTGLSGLEQIEGDMQIWNNGSLQNLSGATRLAQIGGSLTLDDNFVLASTKGLETLQSVQHSVTLTGHPVLSSLEGFAGLSSIGGTFMIGFSTSPDNQSNYSTSYLTNLSGLDALIHAGAIHIDANPQLASLQGLNQLTTVTNYIHLADNPRLENLQALANLTTVSTFSLQGNTRLRNLQGLEQVRNLDYLTIKGRISTTPGTPAAEGLNSLTGIESVGSIKHLNLTGNPLQDLSALNNVSITESLSLNYNLITALPAIQVSELNGLEIFGERISSLEGLNNITRLGYLALYGNNQLTDLSALDALTRVDGGFAIANNENLCQCAAGAGAECRRRGRHGEHVQQQRLQLKQ